MDKTKATRTGRADTRGRLGMYSDADHTARSVFDVRVLQPRKVCHLHGRALRDVRMKRKREGHDSNDRLDVIAGL